MKERISATVDKETIKILKELVEQKKYRNYSHAIESAIQLLKKISEEEDKK
jgi:Arc/MetJ-type ribon-helix-helix transcriptional regulator